MAAKRSSTAAGFHEGPDPGAASGGPQEATSAATDGHTDEASGGGGGGGTPYQPIPLQKHLGNRKTHRTRFVYSGTTFVGPSFDCNSGCGTEADNNANTWYRFPWEYTQAAIRAWEAYNQAERYLFWRAHNISIEFKNLICIQDQANGTSGEVTAGQNLHAQLFAYQDNLYTTGIANSFNTRGTTFSQAEIEEMMQSWGNHGYKTEDGTPFMLPKSNISRNSFQHNFPDVKQCGMGGGNRIAYQWNLSSKYWRSTMELYNQASPSECDTATFHEPLFVRWDEQFGRVGMYADDNKLDDPTCDEFDNNYGNTDSVVQPRAWVRIMNRNLRNPETTGIQKTFWHEMPGGNSVAEGSSNRGVGINQYYRDPEPIPQLWLQLQPQLNAITSGLGNSVAQLQFEIHIDIELLGQCPSIMEASSIIGGVEPITASYARRWINNLGWKMPIFYPIVETDDYTSEVS